MKRFLSIFVAIVMAMTMVVPAFAYTDTKDSDYNAAITFLSGLGVVNGYEDGSYQPEKVVTRAEMAKLLVVALGLDAGASLLEGTSSFDDVPTTHWATGYIAVAVQYGLIKGDGDGNFRPDDTVNYAEVATMALRALGYDRVVDKNGQWPTNYLNKANELKIFDEIANKFEGTDGATRGTVAQMLWNMLNTQMWAVTGENENDGLNYSKGDTMIEVKFPEYSFVDNLQFVSATVTDEKEEWVVTLDFANETIDENVTLPHEYEYAGNDFYTFVPGTEFEALIYTAKKADPVVVSMFATDDNELVEGNAIDLAEDYTNYTATENTTYAYLLLDSARKSATVKDSIEIAGVINSSIVTDIEVTKTSTKIYLDGTVGYNIKDEGKEYDEDLIIKNGERATVLDLEIGDVLTIVDETENVNVIVVSNDVTEGTYEGYSEKISKNESIKIMEVDGNEIDVRTFIDAIDGNDTNIYVLEDEEEVELNASEYSNFIGEVEDNEYIDQNAVLYFNIFGDLVKVVFGETNEIIAEGNFYLVTTGKMWAVSDSEGSIDYIQLANEEGTNSYVISEDIDSDSLAILTTVSDDPETNGTDESYSSAGKIVWVEFDDDNEIVKVIKVAEVTNPTEGEYQQLTLNSLFVTSDDYSKEYENPEQAAGKLENDTNNYLGAENAKQKITSNTVVYTVKQLEDEDGDITNKFTLEVSKGIEEVKNIDGNRIVVVKEESDNITNLEIAYAFVLGSTESDDQYGVVEEVKTKLGVDYITISGTEYEFNSEDSEANVETGDAVIFTINEEKVKVNFIYKANEIKDAGKITEVNGKLVSVNNSDVFDLDVIANDSDWEDYKVFVLEVEYDEDDAPYFVDFEEVELDAIKATKNQGVAIDRTAGKETIVFINGIDWSQITVVPTVTDAGEYTIEVADPILLTDEEITESGFPEGTEAIKFIIDLPDEVDYTASTLTVSGIEDKDYPNGTWIDEEDGNKFVIVYIKDTVHTITIDLNTGDEVLDYIFNIK